MLVNKISSGRFDSFSGNASSGEITKLSRNGRIVSVDGTGSTVAIDSEDIKRAQLELERRYAATELHVCKQLYICG